MPAYSIPHRYTLAEIEVDPVPIIGEVRAAWHELHWGGIGWGSIHIDRAIRIGSADYYKVKADTLERERAEMTEPRQVEQFLRAARYIEAVPRTKAVNSRHSSYGWKHRAERWSKNLDPIGNYYVGEGMFACAAVAMGLVVHWRPDLGCRVNLGAVAWNMGTAEWLDAQKVAA